VFEESSGFFSGHISSGFNMPIPPRRFKKNFLMSSPERFFLNPKKKNIFPGTNKTIEKQTPISFANQEKLKFPVENYLFSILSQ
jgi:uncharacterized membrane protein YagU involved in acid resistance